MQLELGLRRRLAMRRTAQVAEAAPTRAMRSQAYSAYVAALPTCAPEHGKGLAWAARRLCLAQGSPPGPSAERAAPVARRRTSPERERPSLSVRVKLLYLSAPSIRRPSRASSSLRSAPGRRRSSASAGAENTLPSAAASSVYTSGESRPAARPASAATAARTRSMRLSALWTSGTVPRTPAEKHW